MSSYLKNIKEAFSTMASGLKLTFGYLGDARQSRKPIGIEDETYFDVDKGIMTLQYPYESLPVPDNARYRLHNEIEDCIVCDKCAKVCPVDCIEIDSIRAPETFGVTSDGTPKRIHAAKFDIDMSKCCFCGLCTTVCPTECLTMSKVYDFSEFEVEDHIYSFSDMSLADIAKKRKELAEFEEEKARAKAETTEKSTQPEVKPKAVVKPKPTKPQVRPKAAAKPVMKTKPNTDTEDRGDKAEESAKKTKPVMKPKMGKPVIKPKTAGEEAEKTASPKPKKPIMKPKISAKNKPKEEGENPEDKSDDKPKPKFRPRPVIKRKPKDDSDDN